MTPLFGSVVYLAAVVIPAAAFSQLLNESLECKPNSAVLSQPLNVSSGYKPDTAVISQMLSESLECYKQGNKSYRIKDLVNSIYLTWTKTVTPISDKLLFEQGDFWFVYDRSAEPQKLLYQSENNKHRSKLLYLCAEDDKWYRFENCPASFRNYSFSLPTKLRLSDDNRLVNFGQTYCVRSIVQDNKVINFTHRGFNSSVGMFARGFDGMWYKFLYPPPRFAKWLNGLPYMIREGTSAVKGPVYDNDKLVHLKESKEWRVNVSGALTGIIKQGDPIYRIRHIYYAKCDNGKWYRFIHPSASFLSYLESKPVVFKPKAALRSLAHRRTKYDGERGDSGDVIRWS